MQITNGQLVELLEQHRSKVISKHPEVIVELYRHRAIFELTGYSDESYDLAATTFAAQYLPCVRMIANLETDDILGYGKRPYIDTEFLGYDSRPYTDTTLR